MFFFQTREALTAEEIYNGCYVDIHDNNNEIYDSLRNNLKVSFDGKRFSYKVISLIFCFISRVTFGTF
jgi:transcription initiation factor TFIIE subunit beta